MPGWRSVLTGIVVVTVAAAVSPEAQQQTPTFRSSVDTVRLDVRVVDAGGAFISDLTKDDFRVLEDGAEQPVAALSKIEMRRGPAGTAPPAPADVSSNASFQDSRVFVLVLDDLHAHPQREITVRQLARRFIERYMEPGDRAAVGTLTSIGATTRGFTDNRAALLKTVDEFRSRGLPESAPTDFPGLAQAQASSRTPRLPPPETNQPEVLPLQWLRTWVDWLGAVPDRRKALVFISEGVLDRSFDRNIEATHLEVYSAASRSNVAIYAVDSKGLPTAPSGAIKPVQVMSDDLVSEVRRRMSAGLTRLADETGGAVVTGSNDFDSLFERVVGDSSSYYMLGYASTHAKSSKMRTLNVRVNRPGARVQVRRTYSATSSLSAQRQADAPAGIDPALAAAFNSPVPVSGVDLKVMTAMRRTAAGTSVAVIVEGRGTSEAELFIGAADREGKIITTKRGALKASGSGAEAVMRATTTLDLKPGAYQVRVAALQNDTGATGSVQHEIEVPDFSKEDLSISGLTLIEPRGDRSPTLRWSFSISESIDVASNVYWKSGQTENISVALTLVNQAGEAVFRQGGVIEPAQRPTPGVDMAATLDLSRYAPGSYQLVVDAKTTGDKPVSARREVAIELTGK